MIKVKFVKYLTGKGIDEKTAKQYYYQVNLFLQKCEIKVVKDFDKFEKKKLLELAENFCFERKRVFIRKYALLHMFLFFEKKDYYEDFKEMTKGKIKQLPRKKLEKALSIEEFNKLISGTPEEISFALKIMFWGALRGNEVLSIRRKSIKMVEDRMRISVVGKGKKRITFFLSKKLTKELIPYVNMMCKGKKDAKIFTMSYQIFQLKLKKYGKEILDKDISTHTVKHTRSQYEFDRNTPLLKVKDILHHSSIKTTLIYRSEAGTDSKKLVEEREKEMGW